jgi:hypothetical protein
MGLGLSMAPSDSGASIAIAVCVTISVVAIMFFACQVYTRKWRNARAKTDVTSKASNGSTRLGEILCRGNNFKSVRRREYLFQQRKHCRRVVHCQHADNLRHCR